MESLTVGRGHQYSIGDGFFSKAWEVEVQWLLIAVSTQIKVVNEGNLKSIPTHKTV